MNAQPLNRAIKAQEELCLSLAQQLRKSKAVLKIMYSLEEVIGVLKINNTTIGQPKKKGRKSAHGEEYYRKQEEKQWRTEENERRKRLGLPRYTKPRVKPEKEVIQIMSTKTHAIKQVYEKKEKVDGLDVNKMKEFLKHNPHGAWLQRQAKDRPK